MEKFTEVIVAAAFMPLLCRRSFYALAVPAVTCGVSEHSSARGASRILSAVRIFLLRTLIPMPITPSGDLPPSMGSTMSIAYILRRTFLVAFAWTTVFSVSYGQDPGYTSINDRLRQTPVFMAKNQEQIDSSQAGAPAVAATPSLLETSVNANYMGRAALIYDNARMADFASGNFLPSAIPVAGSPFASSGSRTSLQANGSAVGVSAVGAFPDGLVVGGFTQLLVQNASLQPGPIAANPNVTIQQAFARIRNLSIGVMETAFADPSAVPETVDLAGPNARTTVNPAGLGQGQGRISYDFFANDEPGGFITTVSMEQAIPMIPTDDHLGTFAPSPDFVVATQYVDGDMIENKFYERWHVQFSSLFRDIALERDDGTFRQNTYGYGICLSGGVRLPSIAELDALDRIVWSVTYGEGISHYITDLNAATDTNDAVINGGNQLVSLPVLAWYAGYTHAWTNSLRSTITFSDVTLNSVTSAQYTTSPYRAGEFAAVNVVYHGVFQTRASDNTLQKHNFFTGLEYLYGHKETLDGHSGTADRLMWVVSISN